MDGERVEKNWSCGFHTDKTPIENPEKELPPDKREVAHKEKAQV